MTIIVRGALAREKLNEARFFYEKLWRENGGSGQPYYFSALLAAGRSVRSYALTEIQQGQPRGLLKNWVQQQPRLTTWLYPNQANRDPILQYFDDWRNFVVHFLETAGMVQRVDPTMLIVTLEESPARPSHGPKPHPAPFQADRWLVSDADQWQPLNAIPGRWVFRDYPDKALPPGPKDVLVGCQMYLLRLRDLVDEFSKGP